MPYPIIEIDPDWVVEQEWLGTKGKCWVRIKDHDSLRDNLWLFKYPKLRDGERVTSDDNTVLSLEDITGMHWSEKIAYELTRHLNILSPKVELAILGGRIGTLTENFANEGYSLYHGNQVLANANPEYNAEQIQHQNDHKMSHIMSAIGGIFSDVQAGEKAKQKFVDYLVFDALICNVDRHHENWGILRKQTEEGIYRGRLAPSYDHASSLGRELVDKHKDNPNKKSCFSLLRDPAGVGRYAKGGHGPIYIEGTGKKGPSPIKLIERCLEFPEFSAYFTESLKRLDRVDEVKFQTIIDQVPDQHMTKLSKDFAYQLLCVTLNLLNELRDPTK